MSNSSGYNRHSYDGDYILPKVSDAQRNDNANTNINGNANINDNGNVDRSVVGNRMAVDK